MNHDDFIQQLDAALNEFKNSSCAYINSILLELSPALVYP